MKKSFFALAPLLLLTTNAFGWGDTGHQVVAEIAERHLTPAAKQAVLNILGPESMALAAIWPDAVRDDKAFDPFKDYHFVEIPTGQTYESLGREDRREKDAYTVVHRYPEILKDPAKSRSEKMIALRYLIHVVGDVHQPLHVGNGIDMGANLCEVKFSDKGHTTQKLHAIWDSRLVDSLGDELRAARAQKVPWYNYSHFASDVLAKNALGPAEIAKIQSANYFVWFKESADLRPQVYPDAQPTAEKDRKYCKYVSAWKLAVDPISQAQSRKATIEVGQFDEKQIPLLSDAYKANAMKIIERRLLEGGLRLAKLLNDTFQGTPSGPSEEEILRVLQLVNP